MEDRLNTNQQNTLDASRQLLYTTVRIDTTKQDGTLWSGTGFVCEF